MKPALILLSLTSMTSALAQLASDPVLAIIWLFLKLVDKQEKMLNDIHSRNAEILTVIVEQLEEIDRRRSADNAALTSTLLAIIAEDNMDRGQAKKLASGLRERPRREPSQRTQDFLLRKLED